MSTTTNILIADDHPLFRKGLKAAIDFHKEIQIISECGDGITALQNIEQLAPDVAILDIDMPGMSGLEVAKALQEKNSSTIVVILTMYNTESMFNKAIDNGAAGYVLKESAANDILECMNIVMTGKSYVSPVLTSMLLKRRKSPSFREELTKGIVELTPMERKVLTLVAENKTTKQIAEELFISRKTVESHRYNITKKLNLQGTYSLLRFAIEHKDRL